MDDGRTPDIDDRHRSGARSRRASSTGAGGGAKTATATARCDTRSIGPSRRWSLRRAPPLTRRSRRLAAGASTPFGHATAARWDLHGVLAPLAEPILTRIRAVGSGRSGRPSRTSSTCSAPIRRSRRWLSREQTPELPASVPDGVDEGFPEEETGRMGSLPEIRARLDDAMDGAADDGEPRRRSSRRRPGGRPCRRCRLPARTDVLAPPGAHGPGRQDSRHARSTRPRRIGSRAWCSAHTAGSRRPSTGCRRAWPMRGGGHWKMR